MSNTMREILFRGKMVDNGEWIEGFAVFSGEKAFILFDAKIVFDKAYPENRLNFKLAEVILETVKQYTDLTDKNGVKIFEGDIVREKYFNDFYIGKVVFNKKTAGFEVWHDIVVGAYGEKATRKENFATCGRLEIIGNIHDTPELLEKSNET